MNELNLLILNCLLYIGAFMFFLKKYSIINISTFLFLLYSLSSVFSLLYFQSPLYYTSFTSSGIINIEAILYLFLLNFIFCSSFRNFRFYQEGQIVNLKYKVIDNFVKIIFFVSLISLLASLPDLINMATTGSFAAMKDDVYETGGIIHNWFIIGLFNRIFGAFTFLLLLWPLYNYLILKRKRKIDMYFSILYVLIVLQTVIVMVSRSILFIALIEILFVVVIFKDFLKDKIKAKTVVITGSILTIFYTIFDFMSNSRFGGNTAYEKAAEAFATLRYAGEGQLNFIGLMYGNLHGNCYGYKMFPFFRRLLGLPYYGDSGVDKSYGVAYLDKLNPNPNFVYYQFAGEMYFNWGAIGAILIACLFHFYINNMICKKQYISFTNLLFVSWSATILGVGIFFNNILGDASNFFFIILILLSISMRRKVA